MQVRVIDNTSHDLVATLISAIQKSTDVKIATAFVSRKGLALLEPAIQSALQSGAYFDFLVGVDMKVTEPFALRYLYDLSRSNPNLGVSCFVSDGSVGIYHPKLYLLRASDSVMSIVGSSNLTAGGLSKNLEINVLIEGQMGDEPISDSYASFSRLKFQLNKAPDEQFIELYSEAFQQQRKAAKDQSRNNIMRAFKEKAASLPRPTPTRRDIVGWLELVYDALPNEVFTNEQVYAYEQLFHRQYPNNRNIRAKIRQQLQILRDMGMIEHLGASQWRKL
jgi:HKD family nuclease